MSLAFCVFYNTKCSYKAEGGVIVPILLMKKWRLSDIQSSTHMFIQTRTVY